MIRKNFEQKMETLMERLLVLGSQVETNIVAAVASLTQQDQEVAQNIIIGDLAINQQRLDIMTDALALIATQQPMAGDLRRIASFIEIAGELERINDYAKGIAKNSLMITWESILLAPDDLTLMAEKTATLLHQALEAFRRQDVQAARQIPEGDDEIDDLFNKIYREIFSQVTARPDSLRVLNFLEWALHNLERAADRVTNICEWVIYLKTGIYSEMDSEYEAPPQ
jgi:phosphate transport system protein